MEGARATPRGKKGERERGGRDGARCATSGLSPEQMLARVVQLEKRMYEHARNLEFEQAARLRDEINDLQTRKRRASRRARKSRRRLEPLESPEIGIVARP